MTRAQALQVANYLSKDTTIYVMESDKDITIVDEFWKMNYLQGEGYRCSYRIENGKKVAPHKPCSLSIYNIPEEKRGGFVTQ